MGNAGEGKRGAKAEREKRLGAALKANLKRRKAAQQQSSAEAFGAAAPLASAAVEADQNRPLSPVHTGRDRPLRDPS